MRLLTQKLVQMHLYVSQLLVGHEYDAIARVQTPETTFGSFLVWVFPPRTTHWPSFHNNPPHSPDIIYYFITNTG